jgi:tripartite-type tricarboxylate transporter receptor subunit TctC
MVNRSRRRLLLRTAATCAAAAVGVARADPPLVIVDPATPGSSTDIFSRALAGAMSTVSGDAVVVENRVGAAGAIAAEYVANAKPDGHTIGLAAVSTHAAGPALHRNLRYDPVRDFAPVARMVTLPSATVVAAESAFQSLEQLVEAARARPATVSFASPGVGSAGHILLEQFSQLAGVRFLHVPYKGSVQMLTDLFGGQLQVVSDNVSSILPHIRSGRIRALALRDVERIPPLPQVPTFRELGFAEVSYPLWFGMVAPGGTSKAVVDRLNAWMLEAMRTPEFQRTVAEGGATHAPSTPEQFAQVIEQWLARFRTIVETAKIRAE